MALTGRAAGAALIGALVVLAFRNVAALLAVDALILAGIAADLLLAAPVRALRLTRAGDARIRLGEAGEVTLTVDNPGPRPLRGAVGDAWPPSPGARPGRGQGTVLAAGRGAPGTRQPRQPRGARRARRGPAWRRWPSAA